VYLENRLAGELSPYLLQHADNPVAWQPWGEEAFAHAREQGLPIFLSIGYSACHWCHVMERESFSNDAIAALLNEHFVCIKVDREELPEVDDLYMRAVQSLTGSGGWPLSVFLTPDLTPFYGGTYFPPYSAYGRPGFHDVVSGLARGWATDPDRARDVGRKLREELEQESRAARPAPLAADVLDRSLAALQQSFDPTHGGFGGGPKFPHAVDLRLCLRHAWRLGPEAGASALAIAERSLEAMARGGLQDHLAGGFHRYCVDERWLVPHFEKMLYDSALLVPAYLEGAQVTGRQDLAQVARGACNWMVAELRLPEGGFASSLDADTDGEEGLTYTWTPDDLAEVLGAERGYQAQEWFGVDDDGHLEDGRSVLHRPRSPEDVAAQVGVTLAVLQEAMEAATRALRIARRRRPSPTRDDKVLASWNGLAVSALAQAHQALDAPELLSAAQGAASFVLDALRAPDGDLLACWRAGQARHRAGLEAYAYLLQGLLDLYEADFDAGWLRRALELAEQVEERFGDPEDGGYYLTPPGRTDLLVRSKGALDGALPAPGAVHALSLLRLAEHTGRRALAERAQALLLSQGELVGRYPAGFSQLLLAADHLAGDPVEVVVAGDPTRPDTRALVDAARRTFRPGKVVALAGPDADPGLQPLLEGRAPAPDGSALAYPCRGYACDAPIADPEALRAWLSTG